MILDAKRGDIGNAAAQFARWRRSKRYGADAVTLNPWMGRELIDPFLQYNDRGCVFLCTPPIPAARDQGSTWTASPVANRCFQRIARTIAGAWDADGNCALVVGATFPEELKVIRGIVGDMPLLIPGIGAQGGDIEDRRAQHGTADGTGLVINSSRGILYASRRRRLCRGRRGRRPRCATRSTSSDDRPGDRAAPVSSARETEHTLVRVTQAREDRVQPGPTGRTTAPASRPPG